MKKKKLTLLSLLFTICLVGCSTNEETINNDEAVDDVLPHLVKNSADQLIQSGNASIEAVVRKASLQVTLPSGITYAIPFEGNVTTAYRNIFSEDVSILQAALLVNNFNFSLDYLSEEEKENLSSDNVDEYDFKNVNFGIYTSGGNVYIDVSDQSILSPLTSTIKDAIKLFTDYSDSLIDLFFDRYVGSGKYAINKVITNDYLPLLKKESVPEEDITSTIKTIFGIFEEDDLNTVMTLLKNKETDTYNLSFKVDDPQIFNRSYANSGASYLLNCQGVDMAVKTWTDQTGIFSGASINGYIDLLTGEENGQRFDIKLNIDADLDFDFTSYNVKNPSFSTEFSDISSLIPLITGLFE